MKKIVIALFSILFLFSCSNAQHAVEFKPRLVGGSCEGCEAVLEYGDKSLKSTDTLPDFQKQGIQIKVQGTIYKADGTTPAENVVLYVYQTNQEGIYKSREKASGWARRHGYIRTWLKTDEDGKYSFYTLKPASYPNSTEPAHIHYTLLEPNGKYYWLGSCFFEDDPFLTDRQTHPKSPRGGNSGVLSLKKEGDLLVGTRDIILGRNIPQYE